MDEWPTCRLADVADIRLSSVDKKTIRGEQPVWLCNYMDVYGHEYITADLPFMEATATSSEIQQFRVNQGDVLITKDSETPDDIGISTVVLDDIDNLVCGYHVALLKPKNRNVDSVYLAKQLASAEAASYFGRRAHGSTRYGLSYDSIANLPVRLPSISYQRRIADILQNADAAIRQTEATIAKLQRMKQGVLHDLLTRGIDNNGELRDPVRHPEQFKDSPLGRIPKEWEVRPVANLLADIEPAMRSGPFGSALLKRELVEKGVPLLGIDNVYREHFVSNFQRFVPKQKARELERYRVRSGDVMITIMGTVGRSCVVPEDIGWALSSKHVWTITFDRSLYSPELASFQFNYAPWVLAHFSRDEQGGIMTAIRSETLKSTRLPVPSKTEQETLSKHILSLKTRREIEEIQLRKLEAFKHGLMNDLLTGRVRVSV